MDGRNEDAEPDRPRGDGHPAPRVVPRIGGVDAKPAIQTRRWLPSQGRDHLVRKWRLIYTFVSFLRCTWQRMGRWKHADLLRCLFSEIHACLLFKIDRTCVVDVDHRSDRVRIDRLKLGLVYVLCGSLGQRCCLGSVCHSKASPGRYRQTAIVCFVHATGL